MTKKPGWTPPGRGASSPRSCICLLPAVRVNLSNYGVQLGDHRPRDRDFGSNVHNFFKLSENFSPFSAVSVPIFAINEINRFILHHFLRSTIYLSSKEETQLTTKRKLNITFVFENTLLVIENFNHVRRMSVTKRYSRRSSVEDACFWL